MGALLMARSPSTNPPFWTSLVRPLHHNGSKLLDSLCTTICSRFALWALTFSDALKGCRRIGLPLSLLCVLPLTNFAHGRVPSRAGLFLSKARSSASFGTRAVSPLPLASRLRLFVALPGRLFGQVGPP